MTAPPESRTRDAVRDEITWRAHLVLAQLMHCRAVAILSAAQREALEVDAGLSLGDSAETGQALLGLTWTEVVALADRIENPWDHGAIRRAALLRRARHELNGRRA